MINAFTEWALQWGIPPEAIWDLQQRMLPGVSHTTNKSHEAKVQQDIRLEAGRKGIRLWRNNNGACMDINNRMIRYGLANDSSKVNKYLKSSDLIGITPVTHKGRTFGVFTSIECKKSDWKYTGTEREAAQLAWLQLVSTFGGIAKFATSKGDL